MKTQDIFDLVNEVINSIEEPYPNDIIDQVCIKIEENTYWMDQYDQLKSIYGKHILNQMIGRHVYTLSNFNRSGPVKRAKSKLIKSYSWLT
jgi:hypothetical protein